MPLPWIYIHRCRRAARHRRCPSTAQTRPTPLDSRRLTSTSGESDPNHFDPNSGRWPARSPCAARAPVSAGPTRAVAHGSRIDARVSSESFSCVGIEQRPATSAARPAPGVRSNFTQDRTRGEVTFYPVLELGGARDPALQLAVRRGRHARDARRTAGFDSGFQRRRKEGRQNGDFELRRRSGELRRGPRELRRGPRELRRCCPELGRSSAELRRGPRELRRCCPELRHSSAELRRGRRRIGELRTG